MERVAVLHVGPGEGILQCPKKKKKFVARQKIRMPVGPVAMVISRADGGSHAAGCR